MAYFVRGVAGFGSGLIAIPLLALMLPLHVVVPLVAFLDYVASASHGLKDRAQTQWRQIWPLLPFSAIGVLSGLYLFRTIDPVILAHALGTFVLLYALYSLLAKAGDNSASAFWAAPAGTLGGLVGALFGTGGPFYVVYLKHRGLPKTQFRATFATRFLMDGAGMGVPTQVGLCPTRFGRLSLPCDWYHPYAGKGVPGLKSNRHKALSASKGRRPAQSSCHAFSRHCQKMMEPFECRAFFYSEQQSVQ